MIFECITTHTQNPSDSEAKIPEIHFYIFSLKKHTHTHKTTTDNIF